MSSSTREELTAAVLIVSDSSFRGDRPDASGPAVAEFLQKNKFMVVATRIVPDEQSEIQKAIVELSGKARLVATTGGTGIAPRDVTPEATRAVLERELPGFGEIMRVQSFAKVRTAILSRAVAGTRGQTLIVNLPGRPSAVRECLEILAPAIREGMAHLRGDDPHEKQSIKK